MKNISQITSTIEVFFSYAHEDKRLRDELAKHLKLMEREHIIAGWHDRDITAGKEWATEIDIHLNKAHLILLLVSADFMASDYCFCIEMQRAMERHETSDARVIPIILRAVDWKSAPFSKLAGLPTDGRPVTSWLNQDEAFENVVQGIRQVVVEMTSNDRHPPRVYWELKLTANFEEFDLQKAQNILSELQRLSDDSSLTLRKIRPGSIILIFEGSSEGFERLQFLFRKGHLTEILGSEIQDLQSYEQQQQISILRQALNDEDFRVRAQGAEALGRIGSNQAVDALRQALRDKHFWVRLQSVIALGRIGSNQAVDALRQALLDENDGVKEQAVIILGQIRSDEAVDVLRQGLHDKDIWIKGQTIAVLGNIGSNYSVGILCQALQSEDSWVRARVVAALGRARSNQAIAALRQALHDKDSWVRTQAAIALGLRRERRATISNGEMEQN